MAVSRYIGAMPVPWLSVPDPGTRGYVERNSITLTSQLAAGQDQPSPGWLGHHATPGQAQKVAKPRHPPGVAGYPAGGDQPDRRGCYGCDPGYPARVTARLPCR